MVLFEGDKFPDSSSSNLLTNKRKCTFLRIARICLSGNEDWAHCHAGEREAIRKFCQRFLTSLAKCFVVELPLICSIK